MRLAYIALAAWLIAAAAAVPVTVPDTLELPQCEERAINPLDNDTDTTKTTEAIPLRLLAVSGATLGEARVIGDYLIHYRAGNKTGTEQLTYIAANPRGDAMPGQILVTIKEGGSCS